MTQMDLADRVGLSRKTVNQIIQGVAPITAETAVKLELALGTPAAFWLNLDANYQEFLARKAQETQFASEVEWLKRLPYKEMVQKGWVDASNTLAGSVHNALSYYGVSSPANWQTYWEKVSVSFRKSKLAANELGIVSAWLRKGELDAQKIETKPFNADAFKSALDQIRSLTTKSAAEFQPQMRQLCAEAGVALVFTPELKKLKVSGATYWLTKDKAIVQVSLLYKSDDHFWFTVFHEGRHVLQEVKNTVFVEGLKDGDDTEADANKFAAEFLIPQEKYTSFVTRRDFTARAVTQFAAGLQIAPGIVVGRLQHDKVIRFNQLNDLKRRFVWQN